MDLNKSTLGGAGVGAGTSLTTPPDPRSTGSISGSPSSSATTTAAAAANDIEEEVPNGNEHLKLSRSALRCEMMLRWTKDTYGCDAADDCHEYSGNSRDDGVDGTSNR